MQKPLFFLAATATFLMLTACVAPVDSGEDADEYSSSTSSVIANVFVGEGCRVGGCSNHICSNADDEQMMTTCEWTDAYACFQTARCEKQDDGECGWSQTDALIACLGAAN